MSRAWLSGAHGETLDLDRQGDVMILYLTLANGLEGDVRLVGETVEVVEALRGLLQGAGSCRRIEAPVDAVLYRPGDECYRQHATARAFLDPVPRQDGPDRAPVSA